MPPARNKARWVKGRGHGVTNAPAAIFFLRWRLAARDVVHPECVSSETSGRDEGASQFARHPHTFRSEMARACRVRYESPVFITTSPLAYAAETSSNTVGMTHPSAADLNSLTDARVAMIKAALQLTPDQQKYWPAVEDAIRARAKSRQARLERVAELRDSGPMEEIGRAHV